LFANELFTDLANDFNGVMEISGSESFVALALQLNTNSRNDPILSILPVADLAQPSPASLVFPHIAIGDHFSTRLTFVNADRTKTITGSLRFYKPDGGDMSLIYNGTSGSGFSYRVPAGASAQLVSPSSNPSNETLVYTNDFNGPPGTTYP